ncbi:MAG: hypothetical protein V7K88_32855 [Nostoc sp.]|uniref:hypothetical protein n=1 Tax=Nostoc sp. TaxID=1180 RepID=UPI002FF9F4C0
MNFSISPLGALGGNSWRRCATAVRSFHKSDRIAIVHCGDLVQSSESLTKIGG